MFKPEKNLVREQVNQESLKCEKKESTTNNKFYNLSQIYEIANR